MKKPVSIKLEPDDAALILRGGDDGFTVHAVLSPELDTLYEGKEGSTEVELPIHAALAVSLEHRIQEDDTFIDDVISGRGADAVSGRKVITLEPGQIAAVFGEENGQISRQLFTTPDIDKLFETDDEDDAEEVEVPAHFDLAYAIMMRLETEEGFRQEMFDWLDRWRAAEERETEEEA